MHVYKINAYLDVAKGINYISYVFSFNNKLDIIINQTFYSKIPQKNTFKNIICIKQSIIQ